MPDTTVTVTAGMPTTVTVTGGVIDVTIDVQRGIQGIQGIQGEGVPAGGSTHQVLRKINATDFNTEFATLGVADIGGAAPIASPSFTGNASVAGNLTVDTNTLFVDAASNKVGIGTTTPAEKLSVSGNISTTGTIELGNASDTTLSRSAAGKLAVEGVDVVLAAGTQTVAGAKTLSGQLELTGQSATTANSAMTRSLVEASFSNPITQGGTIIQVQATALSRSTLLNGGTSLIANLTSSTPRVTCTTTLDSSAVLRATANDGITTRVDSSNRKLFADKYGWFFIGYLGARGLGSRGKVIIGGNSTPAEMIVEGTLGSNGIALESYPLVANTPRFRLVVRNGATTTVGAFSGTGVYSIAQLGQWWIVMESGTTSAYYRLEQGAWNLICSVAAVPASSTVVSGNGIAIVAYTPDAAATAGSTIQLNIIYETFGITPD